MRNKLAAGTPDSSGSVSDFARCRVNAAFRLSYSCLAQGLTLRGKFPLSTMLDAVALNAYLQSELPAALELLRQMVGINNFTLNQRA